MPAFLVDTFTDTNGTVLASHTPDTGGAWSTLGDFRLPGADAASGLQAKINSNTLTSNDATNISRAYRNASDPVVAEYDLTATFRFLIVNAVNSAARWMLAARMSDTDTASASMSWYAAGYLGSTTAGSRTWTLRKWVSGTQTTLASSAENPSVPVTKTVLFEIRNATKRLLVDGVEVCTSTDNTITQVGRVGVTAPIPTAGYIDDLTATSVVTGTAASTLGAFTQAAAGTRTVPVFTGTSAQTLPSFTQSAAGTHVAPVFTGSAASTLAAFTQAAAGAVTAPVFTATAAQTLPAFTQAADGTFTSGAITGTAASTLAPLTQAATGTHTAPVVTGAAGSALSVFTQAAVGTHTPPTSTGLAASVLASFGQTATGTRTVPIFSGTAATLLASFTQHAVGNLNVLTPTPAERILRIPPEVRVLLIVAEVRRMTVARERRVLEATR